MLFINTILISLISINILFAEEKKCPNTNEDISVKLITDGYYDYENYLHYSLGNFTSVGDMVYDIEITNESKFNDIKYDLIFGEYINLKQLLNKKIKLNIPRYVNEYYDLNLINNNEKDFNIHPLDLDTFIIISKKKLQLSVEEDLFNFDNQYKYTLSQSFYSNIENIKFLNYLSMNKKLNFNHPEFESILFKQRKKYSLLNKNTFSTDYYELVSSSQKDESIFEVNSDGFAYKEGLDFIYYPNSEEVWDEKNGKFSKNNNEIKEPSFYGFSVLVNSQQGYNYLCNIIQPSQREILIRSFEIGISPLSINDVGDINNITTAYKKLLKQKSNNVKEISIEDKNIFSDKFHNELLRFITKRDSSIFSNKQNYFF